MRDLPHIASRLFGVPLLVDERKLDAIVPAFLRRLEGMPDEPNGDDERNPGEMCICDGVAVIPIIGSLVRRKTAVDAFSGLTSYGDISRSLQCALDDARVRAILLQLDTFGGEAPGCFELCDEIFAARSQKPIWASADVDALSAGYAIASQATRFIIAPSGCVASIGVVAVHCERSQLNEAMGLTYTVFRAGARKADFNQYEPLAPEAAKKLQTSMNRTRDIFVSTVARGRASVSPQAARATEGQWYDPEEALSLSLVDGIATFEAVLAELAASVATPAKTMQPPEPLEPIDGDDLPGEDDDEDEPPEPEPPTSVKGATAMTTETKPTPDPAVDTNVVNLDTARAEGRAAFAAETREIAELCMIAGKPALAAEFIAAGASVADVRKKLIDDKAEADAKIGSLSTHQPVRADTSEAAIAASWKAAFANVHAQNPATPIPDPSRWGAGLR
jgi:capsid assembly protease